MDELKAANYRIEILEQENERLRAEASERSGYLTEQYNLNASLVEKVGRLEAEMNKFFDLWQDRGDEAERLREFVQYTVNFYSLMEANGILKDEERPILDAARQALEEK
jgi:hypothetical protein